MTTTDHDHPLEFVDLGAPQGDDHDPGPLPAEYGDPPEVDVDMPEQYLLDTELDEQQRQRWFISDDSLASWAMRKLAMLRTEQRRDDATSAAEYERIDAWFSARHRSRERDVEFFTRHLEDYGRRCRAAGRRSVSLPTGDIRTREVATSLRIVDEAAALEWARDYAPAAVRTKESVNLTELKASLIRDGVVPGGCEVTEPRLSVSVQPVDAEVVEEVRQ